MCCFTKLQRNADSIFILFFLFQVTFMVLAKKTTTIILFIVTIEHHVTRKYDKNVHEFEDSPIVCNVGPHKATLMESLSNRATKAPLPPQMIKIV